MIRPPSPLRPTAATLQDRARTCGGGWEGLAVAGADRRGRGGRASPRPTPALELPGASHGPTYGWWKGSTAGKTPLLVPGIRVL